MPARPTRVGQSAFDIRCVPDRRLATLHVSDRALGTSGSGTQYFHYAGKRYGHVIDPRTGRPAEGVLSVTVIAAEAAEADALATAFYVLGPDRTAEYCRTHQDVGAVMTCPGSRPDTVEALDMGPAARTMAVAR